MDTIESATTAAESSVTVVKEQPSAEPAVATTAVVDQTNGHHTDVEQVVTNGDAIAPALQPRCVTGFPTLSENVQHAVEQFAELDGFLSFETNILSVEGELIKVQLIGNKTVNGFNLTDIELKLIVTLTGDVVKVSKDYVVVPVIPVVAVAAPVVVAPVVVEEEVATPYVAPPLAAAPPSTQIVVEEVATPNVAPQLAAAPPSISISPAPVEVTTGTGLESLPLYVQQALDKVATDEGFTSYTIDIIRNSAIGDGFIGDIVKAKVIGNRTVNGVTYADYELALIVKIPPESKIRRELFCMNMFEREVLAYTQVLPTFMQFQKDHGLKPGSAGFHSFPKVYYGHFDGPADEAVIIMEDLMARGFSMEDKMQTLEYPYAKLVLERLAELHGISLAMKQQRPAEFARFKDLEEMLTNVDPKMKDMMNNMVEAGLAKALETLGEDEAALKEKVVRAVANMDGEVERYKGEFSEPYSVINHGDCWTNNMMFKYESGQKLQLVLYDWQCVRYSSPVLDIVYFLFMCTDAPLRAKHYDDLIQGYHHALRAQLERLGADVNELFPFTAMLRQLKQYGRFALGVSLMSVQMLCIEKTDMPNMDDLMSQIGDGTNVNLEQFDFFTPNSKSQKKYEARISGILRDLNRKGFL